MIASLAAVDFYAKRCVAYPALLVGIFLASASAALITFAAWLTDVDLDAIDCEDDGE